MTTLLEDKYFCKSEYLYVKETIYVTQSAMKI